jgi:hypothetical protein
VREFNTLMASLRSTHSSPKADEIKDRLYALGAKIVPSLLEVAGNRDEEPRMRAHALELAANLDFRAAETAVYGASNSQHPEVRMAALEALSSEHQVLGPHEIFKRIATVVDMADNDASVLIRQTAQEILDEHGI